MIGIDELGNDEAETVALSGEHLDELLAASGENEALPDLGDVDVSVETTVVIAHRSCDSHDTSSRESLSRTTSVPETTCPGSYSGIVAYTLPPPAVTPLRRTFARHAIALSLGVAGLCIGMLVATAVVPRASSDVGRTVPARAATHERVEETNPLVSPTRQKAVAPKRPLTRAQLSAQHSAVTATATATAKAAPAPTEADDTQAQLLEDHRLVMAAQLERSL